MQEFYYELVVKVPLQFKELFLDFIYDLSGETIQEDGNTLILRSECELDDLYYNLELLALELSAVTAKEVKIEGTVTKKENRDWIESYKSGVEPVAIGSFYVRAPWHKKDSNAIDVIIEPALAFGSGHHESTSLCILMLEEVVKSGCRLLDVGSGSGILGICAAKLGAKVDFCDTDEAAVDVSRKNYALNSVSFVNSWVGGCSLSKKKYDIVVANIVADILVLISSDLIKLLESGSYLLLSGILGEYRGGVLEAYKSLKLIEDTQKNDWVSLLFRKE